jgi:hypothetical protein
VSGRKELPRCLDVARELAHHPKLVADGLGFVRLLYPTVNWVILFARDDLFPRRVVLVFRAGLERHHTSLPIRTSLTRSAVQGISQTDSFRPDHSQGGGMRSFILPITLLWSVPLVAVTLADERPRPSGDAVQVAFEKFVNAASRADRPAELEAREALVSLGPDVVPKLTKAARGHSEPHVRRSCYELLMRSFADDERTADALIQHGMVDENPGIRYYSAASLGELRDQQAEPTLRAALERANEKRDPIRFTLAVALARHGKADVLPVLIDAVSDEAYAWRDAGNAGLKVLSGKSLEDFDGYDCREGAWTSGGTFSMPLDPLTSAERKAGRFQAATAYLKWLKAERPELYRSAQYRAKARRTVLIR